MSEAKFPTGISSGIWSGLSQLRSVPLPFCLFLLWSAGRKAGHVLRIINERSSVIRGAQVCASDPKKHASLSGQPLVRSSAVSKAIKVLLSRFVAIPLA